jgi:glutamyl-tRNA reductase
LLDGAVPGDIDPATDRLEEAFVYTLDDLERVALAGRTSRESAAEQAWQIVDDEVATWQRRQVEQGGVPALVALRRHFEEMREEVLAANPQADAAEATRLLMNRLLHHPSRVIRELAVSTNVSDENGSAELKQMIQHLFRLSDRDDGR